jgi:hypothetical protein
LAGRELAGAAGRDGCIVGKASVGKVAGLKTKVVET